MNDGNDRSRTRIAVLVDCDNVSARHADAIFEEIAKHGEAVLKRAYADFSQPNARGWNDKLARHSLLPVHAIAGARGKNSTDIAMTIDAMDLLHTRSYDAFFLVTSDSDFARLAQRLREGGVEIYVIGEGKANESLRKACRRFFLVENLAAVAADDATEPALPLDVAPTPKPVSDALKTLTRAYERLAADHGDGWVPLRKMHATIANVDPDFDARSFGVARLGDLAKRTGRFEVEQRNGQGWWVKAKRAATARRTRARPDEGVRSTMSRGPAKPTMRETR